MLYRFGEFELRPERYELRRSGELVPAEPRVLEVLIYLIAHRDRIVPRRELFDELWPQEFVSDSALTRSIREIRRLLGDRGKTSRWIKTVYGRGVVWKGEVEAVGVSVAVLPFENTSGDPRQEYFADGMTEALINEFARLDSLHVISRTSVMRYKGARRSLQEIGHELGVQYVVEGSVLRDGDRIRVQTRLVRTSSDHYLWAERYDRELRDILSLQTELAHAIVEEVNIKLTPQEQTRLSRARPQVDPEVYTLDLVGRFVLNRRTEDAFRHALRCFEQAVERDPTYAPAWVGVADCYNMLGNYGFVPPDKVHAAARSAATKALELDPTSGEAHRALAQMAWNFEFDWEAAGREYEIAVELNPNSSLVRWWYGVYFGIQGRFDEALEQLRRAQQIDPLSVNIIALHGWMNYFARRHKEALPFYERALQIDPHSVLAHWMLGQALVELGEFDRGIASLEHALFLSPRSTRFAGYLGYSCGKAGRRDEAQKVLDDLVSRRQSEYVPAYFIALVHVGLGDGDSALTWLERAWAERDTMLRDLKIDPPWEILHPERRYQTLLKRLGVRWHS